MGSGPWTGSTEVVHGPGPWGGPWTWSTGVVHGPGSMFCIRPSNHNNDNSQQTLKNRIKQNGSQPTDVIFCHEPVKMNFYLFYLLFIKIFQTTDIYN